METIDLVKCIRDATVEHNLSNYRSHLYGENPPPSHRSDFRDSLFWRRINALYAKLDSNEKGDLLQLIRHISFDAILELFGVLDGKTSMFRPEEDYFFLGREQAAQLLDGKLQAHYQAWEALKNGFLKIQWYSDHHGGEVTQYFQVEDDWAIRQIDVLPDQTVLLSEENFSKEGGFLSDQPFSTASFKLEDVIPEEEFRGLWNRHAAEQGEEEMCKST